MPSVLPKFTHLSSGGLITGTNSNGQACTVQYVLVIGFQQIDQWVKTSSTLKLCGTRGGIRYVRYNEHLLDLYMFCFGLQIEIQELDTYKHQPLPLPLCHKPALPNTVWCGLRVVYLWTSRAPPELAWLHVTRCCSGYLPVLPCCQVRQQHWLPSCNSFHRAAGQASHGLLPHTLHWKTPYYIEIFSDI